MRRAVAALFGIGAAASLLAIDVPGAAAASERSNCYRYPVGEICVVRGWSYALGSPFFYGRYKNTGASTHTGHIDLYIWSGVVLQGNRHTVSPGGSFATTHERVIGNTKVRADWVTKDGTHNHSPTKRAYAAAPG